MRPSTATVSLWEMLERYALMFSEATRALVQVDGWWADSWAKPVTMIGDGAERPSDVELRLGATRDGLVKLRDACVAAGMLKFLPEIDRVALRLTHPFPHNRQQDIRHLRERIRDELSSEYFFRLERQDVALYGQSQPFGEAVADKFPLATEDLQSAGDCLALRQPTAAVFHLMRAMEVVVQRLAKRLKIKNLDRVWGMLLSDIDTAIKAMPKGAKKDRWSEARANLYHVKQAWRNDTMHPKQTYTQDQAREVFNAMGTFARQLATLL